MSTAAPGPVRVKFVGPGDSPVDRPTADVGAQRPAWGQAEPGGGGLGAPVASILETVLSVFKDSSSSGSSACSSRSSSSSSLAPGGLPTIAGAPTTSARGAADGATLAGSETGTRTPAGWRASASGVPPASAVCERSKQSSCQQLAVPLLAASTLSAQGLARASLQLETPLLATVSRHSQAGELARGSKGSITSHHHHHHHHHQNGDAEAGGGAAADGAVKKRTLMGRLSPWICMPNRKAKVRERVHVTKALEGSGRGWLSGETAGVAGALPARAANQPPYPAVSIWTTVSIGTTVTPALLSCRHLNSPPNTRNTHTRRRLARSGSHSSCSGLWWAADWRTCCCGASPSWWTRSLSPPRSWRTTTSRTGSSHWCSAA